MNESSLHELFEQATRDVPVGVLRPPLSRIRRRGARRWVLWSAGISTLVGGVLVASGLVLSPSGPDPQPEPTPPPPAPTFAFSHAYATEGGRVLTLYVFRPGRCGVLPDAHTTVSESDAAVTVSVTGNVVQASDCTRAGSPLATVRLDRPLGGRVLRDGARDLDRPVFRQDQLPVIPTGEGGWSRPGQSMTFEEGGVPPYWIEGFTKPGGPDVGLVGLVKGTEPGSAPAIGQIRLGTRNRALHPHPQDDTFVLIWEEGGIEYRLTLSPSEGGRVSETQFRAIVATFTWP